MRDRVKRFLLNLLFVIILVSSLAEINQILSPKYIYANSSWPTTSSYKQFYKMKKNSIDVLFLGSSVCVNAFSPQEIYNTYGIRSYNLGSEQQSLVLSYYWLKEALRFQKPKVAVIDTKFCYLYKESYGLTNMSEGLVRKCLDPMRWSMVKVEAVNDICRLDKTQSRKSYYFTNIRFHTRWKSLTDYDFKLSYAAEAPLKGFGPLSDMGPSEYETFVPSDSSARSDMMPTMQEYLEKIAQLCSENQVKLVMVNLPENADDDGIHNTLTQFAAEHGADFYDLCEKSNYEAIGAVLPKESTLRHANIWGSVKLSDYIGGLLAETYEVPSVTDEQWEETKDYYEYVKDRCDLQFETDFSEYLKMIDNENFTVFISVKDEGVKALTKDVRAGLRELGIETQFKGKYRNSFYAVISHGEVISEAAGEEKLNYEGVAGDQALSFSVVSAGHDCGNVSSIVLNGTEYSQNKRGMNLVVYDEQTRKVVDSVCFDTHDDLKATRKKS